MQLVTCLDGLFTQRTVPTSGFMSHQRARWELPAIRSGKISWTTVSMDRVLSPKGPIRIFIVSFPRRVSRCSTANLYDNGPFGYCANSALEL